MDDRFRMQKWRKNDSKEEQKTKEYKNEGK